nr:formyl transferase [Halomonas sp. QHL1]
MLFQLHFRRRDEAEERFFNREPLPNVPRLDVSLNNLNSLETQNFLQDRAPRLVLSYGCHKLSASLMKEISAPFWNTHGGLSPQYRGVATHFWPSFLLEPQMTGMTLHETTPNLDAGGILHQTSVELVRGDGLHDVAARCVKTYADKLPKLLVPLMANDVPLPQGQIQKNAGKLWLASDWRPEHLFSIYEHWQDRIVDALLAGDLIGRSPMLTSVIDPDPVSES